MIDISRDDFENAVGDALDQVPEELLDLLDNVVFLVEDEPNAEQARGVPRDEDGRPALLGLYDGVALTDRDAGWSMAIPDQIFIFQGPLSRMCTSREELVEEITVTVIHEIAHHFGIDDDRLHELGWD